jgi:hypothetical protein
MELSPGEKGFDKAWFLAASLVTALKTAKLHAAVCAGGACDQRQRPIWANVRAPIAGRWNYDHS